MLIEPVVGAGEAEGHGLQLECHVACTIRLVSTSGWFGSLVPAHFAVRVDRGLNGKVTPGSAGKMIIKN
jgi:hypothetical protein